MAKNKKNAQTQTQTQDVAQVQAPVQTQDVAQADAQTPTQDVAQLVAEVAIAIKTPTNIEELWIAIDARLTAIETKLGTKIATGNGRGPISTRSMSVDDAVKITTGDLKSASIKECAKELGLSYGQIYSARNGYTFKAQYAAMKALVPAKK